ncbi:MAG: serine/threonine-protein kinase, partial [Myxococcota bacterium]|nr:serine/threonine-protein kinase [Myxococcota bacterium]
MQSTATNDLLLKIQSAPKLDQERFRAEDEIGKGGVGAVTRVHDKVLNRSLAMKTLLDRAAPRDEEERRMESQRLGRFLEEAQVTSQLDHPGVVPVHELGLDQDGKVFFTMRLVKGRTVGEVFDDVANQREDWTLTRALEVVLKMCDTMAYAHEKRVLHRDLKPANVMVGRFGEVYVMDWGLAKILGQDDRHDLRIDKDAASQASVLQSVRGIDAQADATASVVTLDGTALGTPSYMPPEQAKGEDLDLRADVYAIGAMLYQLLTGQVPYVAPGAPKQAYRILEDVWRGPPEPIEKLRAGVPPALVAITEKAMAREREDRYASVADLADDLRAFLENRVVSAHRTGALVEMKKWVQRNKAFAAAAAAAAVSLVAGIIVTWQLNQETQAALNTAVAAREEADTAREEAVQAQGRAVRLAYSAQFGAASIAQKSGNVAETQSLLARCQEEQRNWEWDHLSMGLDPSDLNVKLGWPGCRAMDLSPDSTRIAIAKSDGKVVLKDAATGDTVRELSGSFDEDYRTCMRWDPTGERLVTCSDDRQAVIWDIASGTTKSIALGDASARAVAWSPDGLRFAAGCDDGIIRVCDAGTEQVVMSIEGHDSTYDFEGKPMASSVIAIAWSPDGTKIASGAWDSTGRIWNASTGKCLQTLTGHGTEEIIGSYNRRIRQTQGGAVHAIAWSPNGEQVLTGSLDHTVRVWEASTGYCLHTLEGHSDKVKAVDWCPDGVRVVSAGETIRVWDA